MDDECLRVNDKRTGHVLLIGHNHGDLYYIQAASHVTLKTVFYGEQTTLDVWHAHLVHSSDVIFQILANKYHIPLSGAVFSNKICHICLLGKACRLPSSSQTYGLLIL